MTACAPSKGGCLYPGFSACSASIRGMMRRCSDSSWYFKLLGFGSSICVREQKPQTTLLQFLPVR